MRQTPKCSSLRAEFDVIRTELESELAAMGSMRERLEVYIAGGSKLSLADLRELNGAIAVKRDRLAQLAKQCMQLYFGLCMDNCDRSGIAEWYERIGERVRQVYGPSPQ